MPLDAGPDRTEKGPRYSFESHMASAPTFSVITVCRNSAASIGDALASVRAQKWPGVQHVVIDGASTDGTQDIIRKGLRPEDIFISEPDTGIYNAMNKGISRVTGDFVSVLNADDRFSDSDVLTRAGEAIAAQDLDILLTDVRFHRPGQHGDWVRHYNSGLFKPSRLRWGIMPAHPGMFVRSALLKQIGGFREDYKIAADFELCVRLFAHQSVKWAHLPVSSVDMALGGASTRDLAARLTINRETVRACRSNGLFTNQAMILAKYPFKLLELLKIDRKAQGI